jgi:Mannosylglycerate hydrolase MGH1-like glycoside hydrolase domain
VTIEHDRIAEFGQMDAGLRSASPWYWWGPYVSERQWGTVREDYSADGNAWEYLPHEAARSTAYRWGEDGLAGFCDVEQRLCLGLALWNGRDRILKERIFGVTQAESNHGEDAKEYWWYNDAVPSHVWNVWRYHYPQAAFPYDELGSVGRSRSQTEPEYELLDTGVFDQDRYWAVEVRYAKADPTDLLIEIGVTNAGPDADTLHVLPTAWFRNTWAWEFDAERPRLAADGTRSMRLHHPWLGELQLVASLAPDGASPSVLCCDNETNVPARYGGRAVFPYPKDGINDHVVAGAATVNPKEVGTKGSFWYQLHVPAGESATLRLRLRPAAEGIDIDALLENEFSEVIARRHQEADDFYATVTPESASADEAMVLRQAFAGMLWSKQFYYYDVARWLDGDPTQPRPPAERLTGRNSRWRSLDAFDIMSMPDKWEYPWFASWDLAFHCVALARIDPAFAKYQLLLVCREWFQHVNGALPAYEWDFGDINPPVQAWAALEVFAIDGATDVEFLSRILDKLLVNFTWWVNREDAEGSNLFEGGFLGLDNIGPLDRSHLPVGGTLRQADATGWMAFYTLSLAYVSMILNRTNTRPAQDLVVKFLQHFALVRTALNNLGLWSDDDGFYFDQLTLPDGTQRTIKTHSLVGVIPLLATSVLPQQLIERAMSIDRRFAELVGAKEGSLASLNEAGLLRGPQGNRRLLISTVEVDRLMRILGTVFDENEFLSPYGLRSLSAYHREHPYQFDIEGYSASIDYEPAESTTRMFGGNSNWRGPVWFPLNVLACDAIERLGRFFEDEVTIQYPSGSGQERTFHDVADDLRRRLVSLFLMDANGRRPCFAGAPKFDSDPRWRDNILFNEYFHGDTGIGLGASHQTGWTGLVADLIIRIHSSGATNLRDALPQEFSDG